MLQRLFNHPDRIRCANKPITIAAKPASKKIKAIPIKALKEMVQ